MKDIHIEKPFMYELVMVVGEVMKDYYPEVLENAPLIQRVIKNEEERFHETLNEGLDILSALIEKAKAEGKEMIAGEEVFKLYDTYGFPVELTKEYSAEQQMKIDHEGFLKAMEEQRDRARLAREETGSMQVQDELLAQLKVDSEFIGYDYLQVDSTVEAIVKDGELKEEANEGDQVQLILKSTPFYAESGGQVADKGTITAQNITARVTDVSKAPNGQHLHTVTIERGVLKLGMAVHAKVNETLRKQIIKNHTATHLLHKALKDVLGSHVNQAGSYVGPDRLRFDFSHFGQVTAAELEKIETLVNEKIWADQPVNISETSLEKAKQMGAMALFGEKYGETVRVVAVGDSLELCGGCHVANTASIGMFTIIAESGIGAGTRRIEALTGESAYQFMNEQISQLYLVAEKMKVKPSHVVERTESLLNELKDLQRENESLTAKLANIEVGSLIDDAIKVNGIKVITGKVEGDMNTLRRMGDELKQKLGSGIVVLGSAQNEKVQLIATVTKDLIKEGYHAGNLIKEVAKRCGGGGGGRPDMAQAGGRDPEKLDAALAYVKEWVKSV